MNWRKTCNLVLLILIITVLAVAFSFAIVNTVIIIESDCIETRPDLWPVWNGYKH